jgi:hypothetical protein
METSPAFIFGFLFGTMCVFVTVSAVLTRPLRRPGNGDTFFDDNLGEASTQLEGPLPPPRRRQFSMTFGGSHGAFLSVSPPPIRPLRPKRDYALRRLNTVPDSSSSSDSETCLHTCTRVHVHYFGDDD